MYDRCAMVASGDRAVRLGKRVSESGHGRTGNARYCLPVGTAICLQRSIWRLTIIGAQNATSGTLGFGTVPMNKIVGIAVTVVPPYSKQLFRMRGREEM